MRYTLNMPADSMPWTSGHALSGIRNKGDRVTDLIQVAFWAYKIQHPGQSCSSPVWYVDVSQGVERKPWGPRPDCFLQQSQVYGFHLDRVLDYQDS